MICITPVGRNKSNRSLTAFALSPPSLKLSAGNEPKIGVDGWRQVTRRRLSGEGAVCTQTYVLSLEVAATSRSDMEGNRCLVGKGNCLQSTFHLTCFANLRKYGWISLSHMMPFCSYAHPHDFPSFNIAPALLKSISNAYIWLLLCVPG